MFLTEAKRCSFEGWTNSKVSYVSRLLVRLSLAWGYASGIVAVKIPDYGEFVLAELTQPFDQPDVTYFFPLMAATEQRLGFRPPYAALDAAFDAFYLYEHFAQVGGFAAVPFSKRGGHKHRQFAEDGAPLCAAGLPMTLKYRFIDRSTLVEHERGCYVCPLLGRRARVLGIDLRKRRIVWRLVDSFEESVQSCE